MDFSAKLDDLQQRAAHAKAAAQAAVSESREQLRQRIDQAKVDLDLAAKDARQRPIPPLLQFRGQLVKEPGHAVVLHRRQGDAVDTSGAVVAAHSCHALSTTSLRQTLSNSA
jgi:hypothetical protein